MPRQMIKDVKKLIEINSKIKLYIFIFTNACLISGCDNKEKIYLDYDEVIFHSYQKEIPKKNKSFTVQNVDDVIHLYRTEKEIKTRAIDYLDKIKITPLNNALTRLSKITIDNLSIEKEKGLPQIFIVKKDTVNDEIKIIEVGQAFSTSEDNFDI